ncbi:hypothetical protein [Halorhabdus tiamatea]|nr:hypothetical protein [Halorhabdus tiamatea]
MSDDIYSQPTSVDRSPSSGHSVDGAVRAGDEAERGHIEQTDSVRWARIDRGGSPIDEPSPTHRAVAARDRLWDSYRGETEDGWFVWRAPGDDQGGGRD